MKVLKSILAAILLGGLVVGLLRLFSDKASVPEEKLTEKPPKEQENIRMQARSFPAQEAQPSPEPISDHSRADQLLESMQAARLALTVKDRIAALPARELHHTPQLLIQAASSLGQIVELEAKHPERKQEFREFYNECSYDEGIPTVTRAQCLKLYVGHLSGAEKDQPSILNELPPAVVHLYQQL